MSEGGADVYRSAHAMGKATRTENRNSTEAREPRKQDKIKTCRRTPFVEPAGCLQQQKEVRKEEEGSFQRPVNHDGYIRANSEGEQKGNKLVFTPSQP